MDFETFEIICGVCSSVNISIFSNESTKSEVERAMHSLESLEAELELEQKHRLEAERHAAECKRLMDDSERALSHATLELLAKNEVLERLEKNLNGRHYSVFSSFLSTLFSVFF